MRRFLDLRAGGPLRWYEIRLHNRPWFVHPGDLAFWSAIYWRVARYGYQLLWCAGIIDVEEGAHWTSATWAPLGTEPRPWPEYF